MPSLLARLVVIALSLGMASNRLAAQPRIVVVGSGNDRPLSFLDESGQWQGISVAVLDEIAKRENWRISRITASWSDLLTQLGDGKIDVLEGITYAPAQDFEFSNERLMTNWAVVYVRPGTPISSLPDLEGGTIAVSERSAHTRELYRLREAFGLDFTVVCGSGFWWVFDELSSGKVSAGLVSRTFGIGQAERYGLIPTPIVFDAQEVRYATRQGANQDILAAIDRYLPNARGDPASAYNRALQRWIGGQTDRTIPVWLWLLASGLAMGLAATGIVIVRDIGRRRRTRATLRIKDDAIESSINGIALASPTGQPFYVNQAFVHLWRLPGAEAAIGRSLLEFWEDTDDAQAALKTLSRQGYWQGELRARRHDGSVADVQVSAHTIRDTAGNSVCMMGSFVDVSARKQAERELRRSLSEKDTLLREIHHRVKNNLQIIASLLYFQAKKVKYPDDQRVIMDGRERLRAMILVHEKLYQSDELASIRVEDYIQTLAAQLVPAHLPGASKITIRIEGGGHTLPVDVMQPCGMIVCELLLNCLKYAFPNGQDGEIVVRVTDADGRMSVTISDNGVGLPADFDPTAATSFGWQLIDTLVTQIGGSIAVARGPGTSVTISFPFSQVIP